MSDVDINKLIITSAQKGGDPAQILRAGEIATWSRDDAQSRARTEGIELTASHYKVLEFLQGLYVSNGPTPHARLLSSALNDRFADQGGSKFLYQLFPGGPVGQGSRLAGVPSPHDTRDLSFGSTY
ncbi:MAG: TusE/DsrC/DsvC family sulfur relay protein [Hyphomicrobium sp.]